MGVSEFLQDVLDGLSRPQKSVPGKYLWDDAGAALFDRVCHGPHYYVTRQEKSLLCDRAADIAALVGTGASVVEFGSGASEKVRILLDALLRPRRYVAVDIAGDWLRGAVARIASDYPDLETVPVQADYLRKLQLPHQWHDGPVLGFFPGNTIGSYDEPVLVDLLRRIREAIGRGWLLVGVDPNRDAASILRGYADPDGLMAAFHRNVLLRLRRELGSDIDPDAFRHEARVFDEPMRTEAHLVARRAVSFRVGDRVVSLAAGESIHTDNSNKYRPELFARIASRAGWEPGHAWLDGPELFSLHLLRA